VNNNKFSFLVRRFVREHFIPIYIDHNITTTEHGIVTTDHTRVTTDDGIVAVDHSRVTTDHVIYPWKAKVRHDISTVLTLLKDILEKVIIPSDSAWNSLPPCLFFVLVYP
jgi:hypothetical protein